MRRTKKVITMKKREDGYYVKTVTVTAPSGKKVRKSFYGKTQRELTRKMTEFKEIEERGRTFGEVAKDWWEEAEPELAIQTVHGYKVGLDRAIGEFGDTAIKDISARDISLYLAKLAEQKFAKKTISNHKIVCSQIFKYAIIAGDIKANPCSDAPLPKGLKKQPRTAASVSDEQIIKSSPDKWIFPYIALYTGMRRGEILALQWKDLDFENNIIHVTKAVYNDGERPGLKEPKTQAGKRLVPLLAPLRSVLLKKYADVRDDTDYIVSPDGKHLITKKQFSTAFQRYRQETGITCTAHQLRHSFATIAFECGVPVKSVQEILGHAQISTTMDIYTDFRNDALKAAGDLLNSGMAAADPDDTAVKANGNNADNE